MKKKRIFINVHYLHLGGAETALIGLLHAIDYGKYDVDLFLESHEGELLSYVPKQVNLLPEVLEYSMVERPIKEAASNGCWKVVMARLRARIAFEIYKRRNKVRDNTAIYSFTGKYLAPVLPNIKHEGIYDLALNFIGQGCIVQRKVRAKKNIGWIHTDYSTVDVNYELSFPGWAKYDLIASISPDVTKAFLKTYPKLADKIVEIENIMPKAMIEERASEFLVDWDLEEKNSLTPPILIKQPL